LIGGDDSGVRKAGEAPCFCGGIRIRAPARSLAHHEASLLGTAINHFNRPQGPVPYTIQAINTQMMASARKERVRTKMAWPVNGRPRKRLI
jgi:hypothetical protein